MRLLTALFAACLGLFAAAAPARAQSPVSAGVPGTQSASPVRQFSLDHAGSLGLIFGAFGSYESIERATCLTCETTAILTGPSLSLDLGASLAVGWEGAELLLRLRLTRLGDAPGEAVFVGFRHYFGRDAWKTFASLEVGGHFRPIAAGGARGGFGVAWDFSPLFGLWAEAAASFALGEGRLFGAQLGLGLQARTYLF